jgi:hypothetical protein
VSVADNRVPTWIVSVTRKCKPLHLLDAVQRDAPDYVSSLIEAYKGLIDSYIHLAMASTDLFQSQGRIRTKDIPMSMAYPDKARDKIISLERALGNAKPKTFYVQPRVLTQPLGALQLTISDREGSKPLSPHLI